jgi:hypothetical protein
MWQQERAADDTQNIVTIGRIEILQHVPPPLSGDP